MIVIVTRVTRIERIEGPVISPKVGVHSIPWWHTNLYPRFDDAISARPSRRRTRTNATRGKCQTMERVLEKKLAHAGELA